MSDVKRRRDEYAEATHKAIVDAALEQFAERGYVLTSLDDVARSARVTKGAIYHHFANKHALFEAVLLEQDDKFIAAVEARVERCAPDEDLLTVALSAYLDASVDPVYCRLALQEGPIALGWDRWREIGQDRIVKHLTDLLADRCLTQRGLGDFDGLLLRSLIGALHEMALAVSTSADPKRAKEEAEVLVGDLVASLRAAGRIYEVK